MTKGLMIIHNLGQPVGSMRPTKGADKEEAEETPEEEKKEEEGDGLNQEEIEEEEQKLHDAVNSTPDDEIKKLKDDVYQAIEEHDDPRDCLKAIVSLLIEGLAGGIEE